MKVLKKIMKIVGILVALAGFAKLVCKFCNVTIKMNKYNKQVVFNAHEKEYDEEPFEKDSIAGLFSGVALNFEKASLKNKSAILDIFGRFSGIQITVPEHWQVELDGVQNASSIDNSTLIHDDDDAPVLNINYDLKFCGVEISNPKVPEIEELEDLTDEETIEELIEEVIEDELEEMAIEDELEEMIIEDFEEDL